MSSIVHFLRLNVDSTLPLYQQIQDNLVQLMDSNVLNTGDALPSERQLSEVYSVNRMTVRQALDGLAHKGFIERRQGIGSFVLPSKNFIPTVMGFSQRMREAGMNPSSRLLHREVITPEALIAHRLNLSPDDRVVMFKRLRLLNDEPLMIETSYLSYGMFPGLMQADLEHESLYKVLKHDYGMVVHSAEHTLEPTLPNAYEAYNLGIEMNMPAMLVRVVAFSGDNIPIELSKAVVRGDRCRYFFRVNTRIPITD